MLFTEKPHCKLCGLDLRPSVRLMIMGDRGGEGGEWKRVVFLIG